MQAKVIKLKYIKSKTEKTNLCLHIYLFKKSQKMVKSISFYFEDSYIDLNFEYHIVISKIRFIVNKKNEHN